MAKQRAVQAAEQDQEIVFNPGEANPKQKQFFQSEALYTCYGGAKAGGKTWALRVKAAVGALGNDGIKILIMRCHYPELEMNHIRPLRQMLEPLGCVSYNGSTHIMTFENGSLIKFGHWSGEESENEYNGQEYDWIFIDEATQFSERAFNFLSGCLRGATLFPKRMYLTCNPGGVGHFWVKRLFIDKDYVTDSDDPEENENPEDYNFIFATVEDNLKLLEASPHYKTTLAKMPNARAYRWGDWDAVDGNYFKEFKQHTHVRKPFPIPKNWTIYRSFDYGLDMLAVMWWAVDQDGRAWCFRSYEHKDLGIQDAAHAITEHTLPGENVLITYAPPDMWNRQKDTGRTIADTFMLNGVPIIRADNNRVQGHMVMRYLMAPIPLKDPYVRSLYPEGEVPESLPQIMFFDGVGRVLKDIEAIQADEDNPNDCAKQPHEITHTVDAVRYFCINRAIAAEEAKPVEKAPEYEEEEQLDYDGFMTGGQLTDAYISC